MSRRHTPRDEWASLYEHDGFGGRWDILLPGIAIDDFSTSGRFANDTYSSVYVPPGYELRLYRDKNFSGAMTTWRNAGPGREGEGHNIAAGGANDVASSAVLVEDDPDRAKVDERVAAAIMQRKFASAAVDEAEAAMLQRLAGHVRADVRTAVIDRLARLKLGRPIPSPAPLPVLQEPVPIEPTIVPAQPAYPPAMQQPFMHPAQQAFFPQAPQPFGDREAEPARPRRRKPATGATAAACAEVDLIFVPARCRKPAGPPKPKPRAKDVLYHHPPGTPGKVRYAARYELRRLADLVTSHNPLRAFSIDSRYPARMQERDYAREPEESAKVFALAQRLEPAFLLSRAVSAGEGPPIITPDGIVLSGNGRTMGLRVAFESVPASAAKYRAALRETVRGLKMRWPKWAEKEAAALVRVVDLDPQSDEARVFAIAANNRLGMERTELRRAAAIADVLPDEIVLSIGDEAETLGDVLTGSDGTRLRRTLRESPDLTPQDRQTMFKPNGDLTDSGKVFVRQVLLIKALGSPDTVAEVETEPQLLRTLEGSLAVLLRLRRDAMNGRVLPRHDIVGALRAAIAYWAEFMRPRGFGFGDLTRFLKQKTIGFATPVTPSIDVRAGLDLLATFAGHPRKLREGLTYFAEMARGSRNETGGMFRGEAGEPPAVIDLVTRARRGRDAKGKGKNTSGGSTLDGRAKGQGTTMARKPKTKTATAKASTTTLRFSRKSYPTWQKAFAVLHDRDGWEAEQLDACHTKSSWCWKPKDGRRRPRCKPDRTKASTVTSRGNRRRARTLAGGDAPAAKSTPKANARATSAKPSAAAAQLAGGASPSRLRRFMLQTVLRIKPLPFDAAVLRNLGIRDPKTWAMRDHKLTRDAVRALASKAHHFEFQDLAEGLDWWATSAAAQVTGPADLATIAAELLAIGRNRDAEAIANLHRAILEVAGKAADPVPQLLGDGESAPAPATTAAAAATSAIPKSVALTPTEMQHAQAEAARLAGEKADAKAVSQTALNHVQTAQRAFTTGNKPAGRIALAKMVGALGALQRLAPTHAMARAATSGTPQLAGLPDCRITRRGTAANANSLRA